MFTYFSMAGLMYLGSCHPITVINDSPLALLGASYQFFSLGLQFEGEPEKIYIKRRVIWDDWTSSYSTNHMNPLPLPIQLLGSTCFNIAQFLSLVDHATCMRNQDPQNFPDDFSTKFLVANLSSTKKTDRLKVLEVPSENLRSLNPPLRRSLRRKWCATGNASCVPKCAGWIGASGGSGRFPMGCLGGESRCGRVTGGGIQSLAPWLVKYE